MDTFSSKDILEILQSVYYALLIVELVLKIRWDHKRRRMEHRKE